MKKEEGFPGTTAGAEAHRAFAPGDLHLVQDSRSLRKHALQEWPKIRPEGKDGAGVWHGKLP